ncbi:hypothetical protein Esti_002665 [Eimeria stiedai]
MPPVRESLAAFLLLLAAREAACVPMQKARGESLIQGVLTALLPADDPAGASLHTTAAAEEQDPEGGLSLLQGADAEDVTSDCVTEHNKKRVGSLKTPLMPVRSDPAVAYQALKYATELVKKGCPFEHSKGSGFGENLYATGGSVASCQGAVTAWYNEINKLKISSSSSKVVSLCLRAASAFFSGKYPGTKWTLDVGHFTQVMWESSTKVGCARTLACEGKSILVCNYSPPGNWAGQAPFSEKVWESLMQASGARSSSPSWQVSALLLATASVAAWAAALA